MPDKQFLIGNGKDIITELVQKYKESIEKKKKKRSDTVSLTKYCREAPF